MSADAQAGAVQAATDEQIDAVIRIVQYVFGGQVGSSDAARWAEMSNRARKMIRESLAATQPNPAPGISEGWNGTFEHAWRMAYCDIQRMNDKADEDWKAFGLRHGLLFEKPQPSAAPGDEPLPMELRGITEALENKDGCWRSCSGCHELNEGHNTGPYSAVLKCSLGAGCSECGGIGAVWDTTNYADMAAFSHAAPGDGQGAVAQISSEPYPPETVEVDGKHYTVYFNKGGYVRCVEVHVMRGSGGVIARRLIARDGPAGLAATAKTSLHAPGAAIAAREQESKDDFFLGICVALQVVTAADHAVTWREIVRAADEDRLLQFAAHIEPEEWALAGFAKYALDELGKSKPARLASPAAAPTAERGAREQEKAQAALYRAIRAHYLKWFEMPSGQVPWPQSTDPKLVYWTSPEDEGDFDLTMRVQLFGEVKTRHPTCIHEWVATGDASSSYSVGAQRPYACTKCRGFRFLQPEEHSTATIASPAAAPTSQPNAAAQEQQAPVALGTINEWLAARLRAAGGEITDLTAFGEECVRWAETQHGITFEEVDPIDAELKLPPEVEWPKSRDVGRIEDMSPDGVIRVSFDSDNDVSVGVYDDSGSAVVEFCTPGSGGGKSSLTRRALIALMVAMEADNAADPSRDWWARRAQKGGQS